jgi:hypothetical protein
LKVDIRVHDPAMPRWWNWLAGFALRVRHRQARRALRRRKPHLSEAINALRAFDAITEDAVELLTRPRSRAKR